MSLAAQHTRLMNLARVHLPGALDRAMQYELFEVFDEFFKKSGCWTEDISFSALTTKTSYELDTDSISSQIIRLVSLKNSDDITLSGATMYEPGILVLSTAPSEADTYTAKVALTVAEPEDSDGYPDVPEWVFAKYRQTLVHGLVGRMMAQRAKPYSDERLAIYNLRRFQSGIGTAKVEALHANLHRGQTWQFPQSFATSRSQ